MGFSACMHQRYANVCKPMCACVKAKISSSSSISSPQRTLKGKVQTDPPTPQIPQQVWLVIPQVCLRVQQQQGWISQWERGAE